MLLELRLPAVRPRYGKVETGLLQLDGCISVQHLHRKTVDVTGDPLDIYD